MLKYAIFTLVLLAVSSSATNVKKCKNEEPIPLNVDVVGCEVQPCEVIKGTTAVMYVHFVGTQDNVHRITTKLRATMFGLTVPYDLSEEDADVCGNLMYDATCPIYKTEDVVYKLNFFVDYNYPEITASVEVSMIDEFDECVACFIVNVKIKKGAINPVIAK